MFFFLLRSLLFCFPKRVHCVSCVRRHFSQVKNIYEFFFRYHLFWSSCAIQYREVRTLWKMNISSIWLHIFYRIRSRTPMARNTYNKYIAPTEIRVHNRIQRKDMEFSIYIHIFFFYKLLPRPYLLFSCLVRERSLARTQNTPTE